MANQISKEDLKSPDQVTKSLRQGFVWTADHAKLMIGALAGFIIIGAGVTIYNIFSEKKEIAQQEKYYLLEKSYSEKKRGFEEAARAEAASLQSKGDNKKEQPKVDPSKKASGDMQKDFGGVVTGFEGMLQEFPSSRVAQMAALHLSEIYFSYKKNDEALVALQKVEKGLNRSDVLSGLVWMQLGNAHANKQDCKGAIEKWTALTGNKAWAFAHDEAKLRMGLCFSNLNEMAKAEEILSEVSKKDDPNTSDFVASREAQKYLRSLRAKKNL